MQPLLENLVRDLRYAARIFQRSPGFTAAATVALGLGIGLNTAVFTAYKSMIARVPDALRPHEIVNLSLVQDANSARFSFSYPDYQGYRESLREVSSVIAFGVEHLRFSEAARPTGGKPALVTAFAVSRDYFRVLGFEPIRGRGFEAKQLPALPALVSDNSWERRFQRDPAILGNVVYLNGLAFTVIGIAPRDFVGTNVAAPDFWVPLEAEPQIHSDPNWLTDRENDRYRLFARLAPGADMQSAQAAMNVVANHLRALHDPHSDDAKPANALISPGSPFPLPLRMYPGLRFAIVLIFIAGAMVLVVACANVSSLQLARARSRQNEIHTRLSLGATRARLVRQLLTESALLGSLAGVIALFCTWALLKVAVFYGVRALPEEGASLILDVAPDWLTLLFVFFVSLLASFLFGFAPALENSRISLASSGRSSTSGVRTRRLQNMLVAAQVALSLVLLITGSMLIRSAIRSLQLDTGYAAERVINLELQFPENQKYKTTGQNTFVHELRRRIAGLTGVADTTSARPPAYISFETTVLPLAGEKALAPSLLHYTYVEPNYFDVLGIPVLVGRTFLERPRQPEHTVILSKSAAEQLWPGENPLGRSLRLGAVDEERHNRDELMANSPAYEVIGIARDTRGIEFDQSDSKQVYLSIPENLVASRPILIRTGGDPSRVKKAIDPIVSSLDPDVIATTSTLKELLRQTAPFITASIGAAIASLVGLAGLLLSLMGIYGTVSYIVALRTREIGIRLAIGAERHDILRLILGQSTRPILAGMAAGIVLASGASFLLRVALYGLRPIDPLAFGVTSLAFLTITLAAAYRPSRRAMRVDPAVALRYE